MKNKMNTQLQKLEDFYKKLKPGILFKTILKDKESLMPDLELPKTKYEKPKPCKGFHTKI
jgi:hypothetical protein